ncbi:hypothetical protein B566_EDAN003822, partial [Ephemera danica]
MQCRCFHARSQKWVQFCDNNLHNLTVEELHKKKRICGMHFTSAQKINGPSKIYLLRDAVPSLVPPPRLQKGASKELNFNPVNNEGANNITTESLAQVLDDSFSDVKEFAVDEESIWEFRDEEDIRQENREEFLKQTRNSDRASSPDICSDAEEDDTEPCKKPKLTSRTLAAAATSKKKRGKNVRGNPALLYSEIKKLRVMNRQLRIKCTQLQNRTIDEPTARKHCLNYMKGKLTKIQCDFFSSQLRNNTRHDSGKRYTPEEKLIGLSIYHKSPRTYNFLRKMFVLPSRKTLMQFLVQQHIKEGINENLFKALEQATAHLSPLKKMVSLSIDGVSLVPHLSYNPSEGRITGLDRNTHRPATQAQVIMVRGLYENFKQPIYYSFHDEKLNAQNIKSSIEECIDHLHKIGITVKCVVCDQCGSNQGLFNNYWGVTKDKPYFIRNGQKVFCFFDPPHLLKSVRNNLKKNDLFVKVGPTSYRRVSWQYIKEFYHLDSKHETMRMADKLKFNHVYGSNTTHMNVRIAAEVFSKTVASGIYFHGINNLISNDSIHTATFIEMMDQLFDTCNSVGDSVVENQEPVDETLQAVQVHDVCDVDPEISLKPHRAPVRSGSCHFQLWQKAEETFSEMKFFRSTTQKFYRPPCVSGWELTISAFKMLWSDLQAQGANFLGTRRVNQDCLENLFSQIRFRAGSTADLTPKSFSEIYKTVLMSFLLSPREGSTNCLMDTDTFLTIFSPADCVASASDDIDIGECVQPLVTHPDSLDNADISGSAEENAVATKSSYFADQLLKKTNCEECNVLASVSEENCGPQHCLLLLDDNPNIKQTLASDNLHNTVKKSVEVIQTAVKTHFGHSKLKHIAEETVTKAVDFSWLSGCETHYSDNVKLLVSILTNSTIRKVVVSENEIIKLEAANRRLKKKLAQLAKAKTSSQRQPFGPTEIFSILSASKITEVQNEEEESDLDWSMDYSDIASSTPIKPKQGHQYSLLSKKRGNSSQ